MNLNEIIERLEEIANELGGYVKVRSVFQPNYPLIADLLTVTAIIEDDTPTVYIGIGDGKEYGTDVHYADEFVHIEEGEQQ